MRNCFHLISPTAQMLDICAVERTPLISAGSSLTPTPWWPQASSVGVPRERPPQRPQVIGSLLANIYVPAVANIYVTGSRNNFAPFPALRRSRLDERGDKVVRARSQLVAAVAVDGLLILLSHE